MKKKILVVDDELIIVKLLTNRLTANGYDVVAAHDGEEALETVRQEEPDLILLDISLPKMNGDKVCELLKKDAKYSKIPIIILTASSQKVKAEKLKEAGADGYIVKPFKPEELLSEIRRLLGEEQGGDLTKNEG